MRFYRRMYLAKDCMDDKSKIQHCLKRRKLFPDYVIITMGEHADQLEIMHSAMLSQPHYRKTDMRIIGAARSKQDAFLLMEQIASDSYAAGYAGNMREYIQAMWDVKQKE